ncbi:hypothetical protein [Longispora albida]|uniref:hypothetical protein n=1 Tax=Longispora albida TaxID=203523 RepID=UPI000381DDF6|nr:hypothetical protein [Longispora albida]
MTADQEDGYGMDALDMQLLALGEAALPDGPGSRLKTFAEMMAAIGDLPAGGDDSEPEDDANHHTGKGEFARDAFELGLGLFEHGDLDRAEQWLQRALRHGHGPAGDKLADLVELRTVFADIQLSFPLSWPEAEIGEIAIHHACQTAGPVAEAQQSAKLIIDEAHRRAESIVALAELRTQANPAGEHGAGGGTSPGDRPAKSRYDLFFPGMADAEDLRQREPWAVEAKSYFAAQAGSGKSLLALQVIRHAISSGQRIVVISPTVSGARWWAQMLHQDWTKEPGTAPVRARDRSTDWLLPLFERAGKDAGELRNAAWRDWNLARDYFRRHLRDPEADALRLAIRDLARRFACCGPGDAPVNLPAAGPGAVACDVWLEQSGGLMIPSDVHRDLVITGLAGGR